MKFVQIRRAPHSAGISARRSLRLALEIAAWIGAAWCLGTWTFAQALQMTALPDQRLWSPQRIRAWSEATRSGGTAPLAVLRIARLGIEVPVLEGTDERTLDRGAGHIDGTVLPGAEGNSGIAAHRDGFFRPLKDARIGDVVEIVTSRGTISYRIERIWIVAPEDVSVLDATPGAAVTLVTCYPFYFVGSAPQRYIVRALRMT